MIRNRPASLLADPAYATLPALPVALDLAAVPEWIKASILTLGGVQPITGAMAEAAGGELHDQPSAGELALFRDSGARFELVFVVVSIAKFVSVNGVPHGVPYAVATSSRRTSPNLWSTGPANLASNAWAGGSGCRMTV